MTDSQENMNRRILVIDDNEAIHEDFCKVLGHDDGGDAGGLTAAMLGQDKTSNHVVTYEIDSAFQGQEGLEKVRAALVAGRPYAMAFVDMRMPPGWDGLETIKRIWDADPRIQIAICTAYSDYPWGDIVDQLGVTDSLLILKKPFDEAEACQMALAMTEKWNITNQRDIADDLLRHDTYHDKLTGLPNRTLLNEHIQRCIQRSLLHPEYAYSLLIVEMDDFKVVNDSLGHKTGDDLLIGIGKRLLDIVRTLNIAIRPIDGKIGRLGGDEFFILLDGLKKWEDAASIAQLVHDSLQKPFLLNEVERTVSVSIGITTNQVKYTLPDDMLRDADTALYQAKARGKSRHVAFNSQMHDRAVERLHMENDLRKALDRNELKIQYQPLVSLSTGRIDSFEALVRWNHPERGFTPPDKFIPLAESTGLIVPIGHWVLCEACRQVRKWQQEIPGYDDLSIGVNVSVKQLVKPGLDEEVQQVLRHIDLDPNNLHLEVTESAVMENTELATSMLEKLRAQGIGIHLDDFGTGYSSLSYLHTLPITAIKVDRSFISRLSTDNRHTATVQAIQTLAENRNMKLIAEGIETLEQLVQLQALNCDLGQGYYFAKPMDAQDATALISSDRNLVLLQ